MANILVVDDEADMRMALGSVLTRSGHTIEQAADGPAALDRIDRGDVDLVLLDIRLPGMDGVQILRKIREKHESLPVIMVTGYGSVESAVEVMKLGASQYLSKPFSNKELVDTVITALEASGPAAAAVRKAAPAPHPADMPASPPRAEPLPKAEPGDKTENGSHEGPRIVWEWVAGLAAVAVGVLVMARFLAGPDTFEVPYQHPVSLVWRGDTLWTADWFTQSVHEYRLRGAALESVRTVQVPNAHITGIAVTEDALFLSDSWKKVIQRRRLDAGLTLVDAVKSPGPNPAGLYWDGRYLWSIDGSEQKFYQHDLDRGLTVVASFRSPGKTPAAVFKDARYFWSADADTRIVYQHRLDNELRVLAKYTLPDLDMGREALSGFTWKDGSIWIGRDGLPRLFRYKIEDFKKHPVPD